MRPSLKGMRTKPRSYIAIEAEASRVRKILCPDTPYEAPLPGLQFFEGLRRGRLTVGIGGHSYPIMPAIKPLPTGCEAKSHFEDGVFYITLDEATTYSGLEREWTRSRFTLFHEVGHVVQHCNLLMKLENIHEEAAALMRGRHSSHQPFEDTEWQANSMAAALLMPAEGLATLKIKYGSLTSAQIQTVYDVSQDAAKIRVRVWSNYLQMQYEC